MSERAQEKQASFSLRPWAKLWPVLKQHKWLFFGAVVTDIIMAGIDAYIPLMQSEVVDSFLTPGTTAGFGAYVLKYLLVIAFEMALLRIYFACCMHLEIKGGRDLKEACFLNLQRLSIDYHNNTSAGHSLSRTMSDTDRIAAMVAWFVPDILWGFGYILSAFFQMARLSLKLAMTMIILAPIVTALTVYFQKKLIELNRAVRAEHSKITASYNEGIMGAKTSKTMALEEQLSGEFAQTTARSMQAGIRHAHMRALYVPLVVCCGSLAASATLLQGGGMVLGEELTLGVLSAFTTYSLSLFQSFRMQAARISNLISQQACVERVTGLIEEKPTVTDRADVVEKYGDCFEPKKENWEPIRGDIAFRDVTFQYPDGEETVLENFSLDIPFGTRLAIVGETGAGKSTLVNLVCRFYEPTQGTVLIDGRDARERSQLWLHSAIGYVLQTPHLFSGTVRENLLMGNPQATEEQMWQAIRTVSAEDVIAHLDKGLDTDVGEGGDLLSTGEKQLISFARAILADPRILILDEATASVDTVTEARIQAALEEVTQGRTCLMIAHRLSTVRNADMILVVRDGKIVEQGTHAQLLAQKGYYHSLYTRQYEDETTAKLLG